MTTASTLRAPIRPSPITSPPNISPRTSHRRPIPETHHVAPPRPGPVIDIHDRGLVGGHRPGRRQAIEADDPAESPRRRVLPVVPLGPRRWDARLQRPKKYRDFNEATAGATRHDGFLSLYQNEDHLYAEIRPDQFDQPILAPITIARGLMMAGVPLNFGDEWVLVFHRAGDKVQLIRRNIHVKAPLWNADREGGQARITPTRS